MNRPRLKPVTDKRWWMAQAIASVTMIPLNATLLNLRHCWPVGAGLFIQLQELLVEMIVRPVNVLRQRIFLNNYVVEWSPSSSWLLPATRLLGVMGGLPSLLSYQGMHFCMF